MVTNTTDQMLSYREAAKVLGVSHSTLSRWMSIGNPYGVPSYKPGKRRVFRRSELEAWLRTRRED